MRIRILFGLWVGLCVVRLEAQVPEGFYCWKLTKESRIEAYVQGQPDFPLHVIDLDVEGEEERWRDEIKRSNPGIEQVPQIYNRLDLSNRERLLVRAVLLAWSKSQGVKALLIEDLGLTDTFLDAFMTGICVPGSGFGSLGLEYLSFRGNQFTRKDLNFLQLILPFSKTLKHLDLSRNAFKYKTLKGIIRSVFMCANIETLDVSANPISSEEAQVLEDLGKLAVQERSHKSERPVLALSRFSSDGASLEAMHSRAKIF